MMGKSIDIILLNYKKKDFEGSYYPHSPPKEGERCKRVNSNGV
jgi:hypothetical protein